MDIKNPDEQNHVTSRGYGLGQFAIFHHPPRPAEVSDFIVNPVNNVEKAHKEFREKFDKFVGSPPPGGADDRHPSIQASHCGCANSRLEIPVFCAIAATVLPRLLN